MQVFRIAKSAHIHDLTGTGARIFGGRWNTKGTSMVYTSESRALATTEYLVHVPLGLLPEDLTIATIDIEKGASSETIQPRTLPSNWRSFPAPIALAEMGSQWLHEKRTLMLRVPSVVVPGDFNVLINPVHPQMDRLKIVSVETFELDPRLLNQNLSAH